MTWRFKWLCNCDNFRKYRANKAPFSFSVVVVFFTNLMHRMTNCYRPHCPHHSITSQSKCTAQNDNIEVQKDLCAITHLGAGVTFARLIFFPTWRYIFHLRDTFPSFIASTVSSLHFFMSRKMAAFWTEMWKLLKIRTETQNFISTMNFLFFAHFASKTNFSLSSWSTPFLVQFPLKLCLFFAVSHSHLHHAHLSISLLNLARSFFVFRI